MTLSRSQAHESWSNLTKTINAMEVRILKLARTKDATPQDLYAACMLYRQAHQNMMQTQEILKEKFPSTLLFRAAKEWQVNTLDRKFTDGLGPNDRNAFQDMH